jgi:butyrate kinase
MKTILVINTGSTSTKVAIYRDEEKTLQANLVMPEELLKHSVSAVDQLPFRSKVVADWLAENGYAADDLDIIACRGGPLPPVNGGAYKVNQLMVDVLKYAPVSSHESALSCMIGANIAAGTGTPVIIYDSVSVDELNDIARYTGYPFIKNSGRGHVLNTRMVSKIVAKKLGIKYEDGTFIVVHLGGSISVSAHEKGRIVDSVNAFNGPMSTQRAGRLPTDALIRLCYSGEYNQRGLIKMLNGDSGYKAYFGTQDARKVSEMVDAGDKFAKEVTCALAYQTAKAVAEMRIAVDTPVDRIIITGGMANFRFVTGFIENKVSFIAPIEILPGEFEMEALAKGALDVLLGKEIPKEYDILPAAYASVDEFYAFVRSCKK